MKNSSRHLLRLGLALATTLCVFSSPCILAGEPPPERTDNLWAVFQNRRSVRSFKADAVPEADLLKILDAARSAPTSGNQQPWKFLVVRDPAKIDALKNACIERNLKRTDPEGKLSEEKRREKEASIRKQVDNYLSAPVFIVVLTDNKSRYPDYNHWDGPLAAGYLMLAARALGYGTLFVTDAIPEDITKTVFGIPDRYTRVCITPLGIPTAWPNPPPKRPLSDFVCYETLPVE